MRQIFDDIKKTFFLFKPIPSLTMYEEKCIRIWKTFNLCYDQCLSSIVKIQYLCCDLVCAHIRFLYSFNLPPLIFIKDDL